MKKLLSGLLLLSTVFFLWSCEKKEKVNDWEKDLTDSWNYNFEYRRFEFNQIQDSSNYGGTIIFHNDNSFECNLDEPLSYLYTKGAWKVIGDQIYMSFYQNLVENNGKYDISRVDGTIQLQSSYRKSQMDSFTFKMKLSH